MIRVLLILFCSLWMSSGYRGSAGANSYDKVILADHPVAYWGDATGKDLTGHHHDGVIKAGTAKTSMPDGSAALDFNSRRDIRAYM